MWFFSAKNYAATSIALDVPPKTKDLIIGFAGNVQVLAEGSFSRIYKRFTSNSMLWLTNPLNCSFTSARRAREFRDMDIIYARMSPCLYLVSMKIVQIARKKITLHYRHYPPLSAIRCANILFALSCSKCPHVCGTCKNLTRVLQTMKIYNILSWNQRGLRSKQKT